MYIQLNSQVIHYETRGQGRPMLLLHGNGESGEIFNELVSAIEDSFTTIAVDSRGQGESATPKEFHYRDMAEDVLALIHALSLDHPLIVGFSDGAIVAMLLAIEHSDLLSGLVLCGGNLTPKGLTWQAQRQIKALAKKTKSPLVKMMLTEPNISTHDLVHIMVPTLVCAGSDDMIKPKETKEIAANIPNAKLKIFEGETHGSYVEHSDALAPILLDFFQES